MLVVAVEVTLDFDKTAKVRTPARLVFESLAGQVPTGKEPHEPGVALRDEKAKFAVRWNYDSCGILQEDVDNQQECMTRIVTLLGKINKVVPIGRLSSRVFKVIWILPAEKYDFEALESKYRQAFIKESPLFNNCFDSSVVVEMRYDKWVLHHQSGAMGLKQLGDDFRQFRIKDGYHCCPR